MCGYRSIEIGLTMCVALDGGQLPVRTVLAGRVSGPYRIPTPHLCYPYSAFPDSMQQLTESQASNRFSARRPALKYRPCCREHLLLLSWIFSCSKMLCLTHYTTYPSHCCSTASDVDSLLTSLHLPGLTLPTYTWEPPSLQREPYKMQIYLHKNHLKPL